MSKTEYMIRRFNNIRKEDNEIIKTESEVAKYDYFCYFKSIVHKEGNIFAKVRN